MSPLMKRFGLWTAPILFGGTLTLYPALMQIAFTFTALLGLLQAYCFRQPWIRTLLGIQPIPQKTKPKATYKVRPPSYQPPTPVAPTSGPKGLPSRLTDKAKGLLAGPVKDIKEGKSSFQKSYNNYLGTSKPEKRKHGRTAAELKQAKKYEEKHKKYEQAQKK